jgi:hypothetical protein
MKPRGAERQAKQRGKRGRSIKNQARIKIGKGNKKLKHKKGQKW